MFNQNSITTRSTVQLIAAATTALVLGTGVAAAWHPVGAIQKDVQNITAGTASSKADTTATAVNAKPGDTLVYRITVANNGSYDSRGWNDMFETQVTDQLPSGLQLVNKGSFDLGRIKTGEKKTVDVTVKVTANTSMVIKNQACFTGDSEVHDQPQKGCDLAYVNVVVPKPTPSPTPIPSASPTPTPKATPSPTPLPTPGATLGTATVATLPETGAPVLATAFGLTAMIGTSAAYLKSRKRK